MFAWNKRGSKYILAAKKPALKVINLALFPCNETIDELQMIEKLIYSRWNSLKE